MPRHIALAPVGNKLRNLLLGKLPGHTQLSQLTQGVLAGLPVATNGFCGMGAAKLINLWTRLMCRLGWHLSRAAPFIKGKAKILLHGKSAAANQQQSLLMEAGR